MKLMKMSIKKNASTTVSKANKNADEPSPKKAVLYGEYVAV